MQPDLTDLPDLSLDQAAVLFAYSVAAVARMEETGFDERKPSAAIPRDVLCCGDIMLLVPAVMVLAAKLYPELMDIEVLQQALRSGSRVNPLLN